MDIQSSMVVADTLIRQDEAGRYCLNDLHKAAGALSRDQPSKWLVLETARQLIEALDTQNLVADKNQAVRKYLGGNGPQGTYVVKELVYAYAMWISPTFSLKVIRAYDAMVTGSQGAAAPSPELPLMLTPEQYATERDRLLQMLSDLREKPIYVTAGEYERLTGERTQVGKRSYITTELVGILEDCGVPRETIQEILGVNNNCVRQHAFLARKRKTH